LHADNSACNRHLAVQRRVQGVNDPPDTAFATLMDELKASRHPLRPDWALIDEQMNQCY